MPVVSRNDEQIRVDTTSGLVSGVNSFTFDGTSGKLDYRGYEPVFTEISGRGIMVKGVDYSWNYSTGLFTLLIPLDVFVTNRYYNVHFQLLNQPVIGINASLINYSFFVRDINIPNIEPKVGTVNPILQQLDSFIVKYEQECMIKLFCYPFYKAFINESSQRISELINGVEYTILGVPTLWKGLVYNENISLIANYIYFFYRRFNVTQTTGVAESATNSKEAIPISPAYKMRDAWNFFSSESQELLLFLWTRRKEDGSRVYPEFTFEHLSFAKNFSRPINEFCI